MGVSYSGKGFDDFLIVKICQKPVKNRSILSCQKNRKKGQNDGEHLVEYVLL